ncbi:MAG: hypothetical protein ACLQLC_13575 [Candidatus Sulfotelmatobacter sp.]
MLRTNLLDMADLAVVFCLGTITSQEDVDVLRQAVIAKLAKLNVVLDFSEVETLIPETMAELAALWQAADRQGARLAIFNPSLPCYLELKNIQSLCRIPILTDAELLALLRQAKAFRVRPSARAARHWGQRLTHALRYARL